IGRGGAGIGVVHEGRSHRAWRREILACCTPARARLQRAGTGSCRCNRRPILLEEFPHPYNVFTEDAMLGATLDARQFLKQVQDEITRLDAGEIERLAHAIYRRYQTGRFVYLIGNGGSGANASHLCEDLGKGSVTDYEMGKR